MLTDDCGVIPYIEAASTANTTSLTNAGSMLAHRPRRWANIKPALDDRLQLAGSHRRQLLPAAASNRAALQRVYSVDMYIFYLLLAEAAWIPLRNQRRPLITPMSKVNIQHVQEEDLEGYI